VPASDAPVVLYDTTLRDGTQGENITLSLADKIRVARMLDEYGMPFIEGGWPGSNPKDIEFFAAAKKMTWSTAKLAAFGSTRHRSNTAAEDPFLNEMVRAETPVVTIFGKSWTLHAIEVLGASLEQNLDMIAESVAWVGEQGRQVVYDAEHYFDGYKADRAYALNTLRAARQAGARHAGRRLRCPRGHLGHPHPQRRRAGGGQHDGCRGRRRPPCAGHHQRLRRALRQRQHGQRHGQPGAQDRPHLAARRRG
jgi:hypothetical protein